MKVVKIIFSVVVGCFFTLSLCMEEKRFSDTYNPERRYNETYHRMVDKLLYTQEDNLSKNIDRIAPETRKVLIELINVKKDALTGFTNPENPDYDQQLFTRETLAKLDIINNALKESLEERSTEKETRSVVNYSQRELVTILDGLVNTDRSIVPAKIQNFTPELKENLIYVFENVLKPRLNEQPQNLQLSRTLDKLEFIVNFLKK